MSKFSLLIMDAKIIIRHWFRILVLVFEIILITFAFLKIETKEKSYIIQKGWRNKVVIHFDE